MDRRRLLATVGLAAVGSAGCVDRLPSAISGEVEYEECNKTNVVLSELPDDARTEARSTIEDGEYETTEEPLLPAVIDLEKTHIQYNDTYWLINSTEDDDVTRLVATEHLPEASALSMVNRAETTLRISRRIVHARDDLFDDPVLIDDVIYLEAGYITNSLDVTSIGNYTANLLINGSVEVELSFERTRTTDIEIVVTESGAKTERKDVEPQPQNCQWKENGESDPRRV